MVLENTKNALLLPAEIKAFVARPLPDYMVPAAVQILPHFSVPANGKVDLKALLKDTILPSNLQVNEPYEPPGHALKQVLLTGATGFLGAYLLSELLKQTQATIVCLVRATDDSAALLRVTNNLRAYGHNYHGVEARLRVIVGTLDTTHFGLSKAHYEALAREVDSVYHNASAVPQVYISCRQPSQYNKPPLLATNS
jgi:FlaA1/EpsC-like NDP-sugar epimerase